MHRVIRTNNLEVGDCLKFHEISAIAPRRKVEFSIDGIFLCSKKPYQTVLFLFALWHANLSWLFKDHLNTSDIAFRQLQFRNNWSIYVRRAFIFISIFDFVFTRVGHVIATLYKSLWNVEMTTEKRKGRPKLVIKISYIFIESSTGIVFFMSLLTYIKSQVSYCHCYLEFRLQRLSILSCIDNASF